MPNRSNVFDGSSPDRKAVADSLYIERGAGDASTRCRLNTALGSWDLLAEVLQRLQLRPGKFLVDVGCGSGEHLVRFAREVGDSGRVLGVDYSSEAISQVRARGQVGVVASGAQLPLPDTSVDALTCNYAIYYFDDIPAVLAEWHRVLKPKGRLVISGPAVRSNRELYEFHRVVTSSGPSDADRMALGFIEDVVAELMQPAGFECVKLENYDNPITFPDGSSFLDYWTATSLFARTKGARREMGEAWFRNSGQQQFVVTKCVSVLSAVRAP